MILIAPFAYSARPPKKPLRNLAEVRLPHIGVEIKLEGHLVSADFLGTVYGSTYLHILYRGKEIGLIPVDPDASGSELNETVLIGERYKNDYYVGFASGTQHMAGDYPSETDFYKFAKVGDVIRASYLGNIGSSQLMEIGGSPSHHLFIIRNEIGDTFHANQPRWPECYAFEHGVLKNVDFQHPAVYRDSQADISQSLRLAPTDNSLWGCYKFTMQVLGQHLRPRVLYRRALKNIPRSGDWSDPDWEDHVDTVKKWIREDKPLPKTWYEDESQFNNWGREAPPSWIQHRGIFLPRHPESWTFKISSAKVKAKTEAALEKVAGK